MSEDIYKAARAARLLDDIEKGLPSALRGLEGVDSGKYVRMRVAANRLGQNAPLMRNYAGAGWSGQTMEDAAKLSGRRARNKSRTVLLDRTAALEMKNAKKRRALP